MTSRRLAPSVVLLLALVVGACSKESTSTPTSEATSTTAAAATTSSSSTSTSTSSTSTTSTSTSTTVAAVEGLGLSATGLGDALFGADADGVVDYVKAILGPSDTDTGWIDPTSSGGACPGTQVRFVTWDDLSLFFTDESPAASGIRHFASYSYGPAFSSAGIRPYGLATDAGISVGAPVSLLQATYPTGVLSPGDEIFPATFHIEDGLIAYLTDATPTGTVTEFVGGFGCGE